MATFTSAMLIYSPSHPPSIPHGQRRQTQPTSASMIVAFNMIATVHIRCKTMKSLITSLLIACALSAGSFSQALAAPSAAKPPTYAQLLDAVKQVRQSEKQLDNSGYLDDLKAGRTDLGGCGSLVQSIDSAALVKTYSDLGVAWAARGIYSAYVTDHTLTKLGIPRNVYEKSLAGFNSFAKEALESRALRFSKENVLLIVEGYTQEDFQKLPAGRRLEIQRIKSLDQKLKDRFNDILSMIASDVNAYARHHQVGFKSILGAGHCGGSEISFYQLKVDMQPASNAIFYYITALQWHLCMAAQADPWNKDVCQGWLLGSVTGNTLRYGQYYLLGVWAKPLKPAKGKVMLQDNAVFRLSSN
jgi:hypothetical protein